MVITDYEQIVQVEEHYKRRLLKEGMPASWGEAGIVYEDPYLTILRDAVIFPGGAEGLYIRMVTLDDAVHGTAILPKYHDKFVLVKHYRHALRDWVLEIPRGFGEKGLTQEQNARKELIEELGCSIDTIQFLGHMLVNSGMGDDNVFIYFAQLCRLGKVEREEGIAEIVLLTEVELEKKINKDEITDSFTVYAWCKYKLKQREHNNE